MGVSRNVLDKKPVYFIIAVLLLLSLIPLQGNIDTRRAEEKLSPGESPAIRPGEAAVGLLLAGFRGVAANMLWFQSTVLFQQGKVTEMIPLFQAISVLQPRFRATWSFGAWHMAYNVSAHFYERKDLTDEEVDDYRFQCFKIAEEYLRKGIEQNYYHYDLHWDLGFSTIYYKQYKLAKERGWKEEQTILGEALKEMEIAALFQPPLAQHPAYVDRIIAIVMREGGLYEDAYKVWYRLDRYHQDEQEVNLIKKHMPRVVETIEIEDAKAYGAKLETERKLAEAYKLWYYLLTEAKKRQTELAADKLVDPESKKQTEQDIQEFSKNVRTLGEALAQQGVSPDSLQQSALSQGRPPELGDQIKEHFSRLREEAEKEEAESRKKTMEMYHELTKPAPALNWWVFLYIPLLLLAAGYLIAGRESYAS